MKNGSSAVSSNAGRFVLAALLTALSGAGAVAADAIQFRSGAVDLADKTVAELRATLETVAAANIAPHVVVQFDQPITPQRRAELGARGLTLLRYLGADAFFAAVDAATLDAGLVAATPSLISAEPPRVEWKLHPVFLAGQTQPWAVVASEADGTPVTAAYITFHSDVSLADEALAVVAAHGANIYSVLESVNGLVIDLPLSGVPALAAEDAVLWIEPPLPQFSTLNAENRALTGADLAQQAPYNLDGTGVNVFVYDAGRMSPTHADLTGRVTAIDSTSVIDHATHVGGTVGGNGTQVFNNRGMAPNVSFISAGFQWTNLPFFFADPGDIEEDYANAINNFDAHIANNSIGSNTATNGFDCDITGDYGVASEIIDGIVRGSLSNGQPFRIVWANGNERQTSRCGNLYHTTAPPACAKNHITVGALNANDDSMTGFSSWGPTDDGRIKPDIAAPGCQSNGDNGVTSTSSSGGYSVKCGTSMASPTVCGLGALILQDFRAQFAGEPDPIGSTLKILLAHNAVDGFNPGPDFQYGYGSVRIVPTIEFLRTANFDEAQAGQGETVGFDVIVGPGAGELKITLAWDDFPAVPNVVNALVNDLDLRVFDPAANRHFPWTLDPANPASPAVRTQEDHVNNIEQVFVESPMAGTWRVEVVGTNVPEGPQAFSIAASPELVGEPRVSIAIVDPLPDVLEPGLPHSLTLRIRAIKQVLVPGSPTLHVRYDGGDFLPIPLTDLGGELFEAVLPPPVCSATPEYYFSAEGDLSGVVTNPSNAPATVYAAVVGEFFTPISDNFENPDGWTVVNQNLTTGAWVRGVPVTPGGRPEEPPSDFDGSGKCWITGNVVNEDVDGGPTILTSRAYDLSAMSDPTISYARWVGTNDPVNDPLIVDVSDDDGLSWINVESATGGGWQLHEFQLTSFVNPTALVRLRFSIADNPNNSVTEGGVDAFSVSQFRCIAVLADCNHNGILDSDDIASGRSRDLNGNGIPDECETCQGDLNGDGVVDLADLGILLADFGCTAPGPCPGDVDGDGDTDLADLGILLSEFGNICP